MIFLWWSLCLSVPVEQSRWQGDRGVPVAVMAARAPVFCKLNVRAAVPHPTVTQGRWSATKQAGFSACLSASHPYFPRTTQPAVPHTAADFHTTEPRVQLALRRRAYGAQSIRIQLVQCTSQSLSNIVVW